MVGDADLCFLFRRKCTARFAAAAAVANNAGGLRKIRLACAAILAREGQRPYVLGEFAG
jgi:hypothetical protein